MNKSGYILVLDGNERSALAITRCLGRHGCKVVVGAETPLSLAGTSRFCHTSIQYTSPYQNPTGFITDLGDIVQKYNIKYIFPVTDVTTLLTTRYRDRWPLATIPFATHEQIDLLSNKYELFKIANDAGIPIPKTYYIDNLSQALKLADTLTYPIVIKPFRSRILRENDWLTTSVKIISDAIMLREYISNRPEFRDYPFLLQSFIAGDGAGYFALYDKGTLIADFCHLRLREKPPTGGVSVLSESCPVDSHLREYAGHLLKQTCWHGVAMVEFKIDRNDGTPYLMEVNTRFWGSLQLAIDAGMEFPYLLYQIANAERPQIAHFYQQGIRLRWLLGDLDRLLIILKSRKYTAGNKIYEILLFLNFFSHRTHYEINRFGDMKPFYYELRKYIRYLIK